MARQEEDKEDLIRDATAMVDRAEFHFEGGLWKTVTAGYRANGFLSLYFDQDPFYQFDGEGRLRRALEDLLLFRSQKDGLIELRRDRSSGQQTVLASRILPEDDQRQFITRLQANITQLAHRLSNDDYIEGRRVSADERFDDRLLTSLNVIASLPFSEACSCRISAR